MRLPPLPSLREILRLYNLRATKQLSQNFLLDIKITDRIIQKCGNLTDKTVIEVGPGPGGLTRSILTAGAKNVIVVEKDARFLPALEMLSQAAEDKMHIVQGDILQVNEGKLLEEIVKAEPRKWEEESNITVVGNLPFNIATQLLLKWLRDIPKRQNIFRYGRAEMILMYQKEVAMRMIAQPSSKEFGRLSVVLQNFCDVKHIFDVKGKVFVPPPKVDGSIVLIRPRVKPYVDDIPVEAIEQFCALLFGHRRKMLRKILMYKLSEQEVSELEKQSGIDFTLRPEHLTVKQICELARLFYLYEHQKEQLQTLLQQKKKHSKTMPQSQPETQQAPPEQQQQQQQQPTPTRGPAATATTTTTTTTTEQIPAELASVVNEGLMKVAKEQLERRLQEEDSAGITKKLTKREMKAQAEELRKKKQAKLAKVRKAMDAITHSILQASSSSPKAKQ